MGLHNLEKKHLSAQGLLKAVRAEFAKIQEAKRDPRGLKSKIPLKECLMAGLALFGLKFPSLLQFNQGYDEDTIRHNLKTLYGINNPPCDTYMRERLDAVDPRSMRSSFTKLFSLIQRGKVLEDYKFLSNYLLVACDGTGMFSSEKVHCPNCCEKRHRDGKVTYYHQMLGGVLIHPDHKEVFPFCPEPISKADGASKNDCEQRAMKRFLGHFRREHPRLKVVFTLDALSAKTSYIRPIMEMGNYFIVGASPGSNKTLFEYLEGAKMRTHEETTEDEIIELKFLNNVPLDDTHHDMRVNFIDCVVKEKRKGTVKRFSWITNITVDTNNVYQLSRGGRARWRIENETFNTLKNQGYNFEHNFGHGYQNLSHVFGLLMFLAFFVDQIQQRCCALFRAALAKLGTKRYLWSRYRSIFTEIGVASWNDLFFWIIDKSKANVKFVNSS